MGLPFWHFHEDIAWTRMVLVWDPSLAEFLNPWDPKIARNTVWNAFWAFRERTGVTESRVIKALFLITLSLVHMSDCVSLCLFVCSWCLGGVWARLIAIVPQSAEDLVAATELWVVLPKSWEASRSWELLKHWQLYCPMHPQYCSV